MPIFAHNDKCFDKIKFHNDKNAKNSLKIPKIKQNSHSLHTFFAIMSQFFKFKDKFR